MRRALIVSSLIAVCAANAFAWGEEGHRIVCRIAYQELTADEQKEVDRLTKAYQVPPDTRLKIHSFPDACVFADEARSNERTAEKNGDTDSPWLHYKDFNDWHFINVARSVKTIPEEACKDDCVLTGIAKHAARLKSGANDQERGEGLFFLGHWLGDVHQPLHVSYADDQGGNKIEPVEGGFYPVPKKFPLNLHAVWDGAILRLAIADPGWREFADDLQDQITDAQRDQWLAAAPLAWAQESYDITTSKDVQYCKQTNSGCKKLGGGRTLGEDYQNEFLDPIELRLQKAGVRLARLIREGLSQ